MKATEPSDAENEWELANADEHRTASVRVRFLPSEEAKDDSAAAESAPARTRTQEPLGISGEDASAVSRRETDDAARRHAGLAPPVRRLRASMLGDQCEVSCRRGERRRRTARAGRVMTMTTELKPGGPTTDGRKSKSGGATAPLIHSFTLLLWLGTMHSAVVLLVLCALVLATSAFTTRSNKRIVIIRHGCTYMNEYLSKPGSRWGDAGFTDIFEDPDQFDLFRDSRLSDRGIHQAKRLGSRLGHLLEADRPGSDIDLGLDPQDQNVVRDIELIACSPLTRALQTTELSLVPHMERDDDGCPKVPVVALPLASERVYLVSDVGRSTDELGRQFPCVDFESAIGTSEKDCWWFTYESDTHAPYLEWRPNDQGQEYACKGEPESDFNARMTALYDWLDAREESTIALVCHWGVIDWLIGEDFENCEMKAVPFHEFKRTGFMLSDEEAAALFAKGERTVTEDGQ